MRFPRVELPHWVAQPRPERPVCGPMVIVGIGILLPILLATYGLTSMLRGEAAVIGYGNPFNLYGVNAVVYGIAAVALGVLLHCAAFWDSLKDSTPTCAKTKLLCLCVMGVCAYVLSWRMLPGLWG